ncbi:MarR family winged helix-turn-helix transcriptional regulator [Neisseria leonii]|uniref:MarR family winged helix-turn-helix transcriptional regulator n=1 Tax=Neisseria leonii TaxID=2995413 RepID=A0A9X4E1G1_9NEIS|nr:MarR family winged helix-turn-helix transcriptional regulator [Neisseria sp. 51.81]MDD9327787.1 MarR family winged helix-turn-helix transcriptional regulator [Neisseria sp. 51.81]
MSNSRQNPLDKIGDICTQMLASYDKFAKSCGIGGNELAILYTLWVDDDCTQKHIADKCQLAKQTVHTLCKRFEADGILLAQTGSDKREKRMSFTDKGVAFAERIVVPLLALEGQSIDRFGRERIDRLLGEFDELSRILADTLTQNSTQHDTAEHLNPYLTDEK